MFLFAIGKILVWVPKKTTVARPHSLRTEDEIGKPKGALIRASREN